VGRARLARAVANLALSPDQVLSVDVDVAPAEGPGFVKLGGTVPLPKAAAPGPGTAAQPQEQQQQQQQQHQQQHQQQQQQPGSTRARAAVATADTTQAGAPPPAAEEVGESGINGAGSQEGVDLSLVVRDGGVDLVGSLVPGFRWESGSAAISLRVAGPLAAPRVTGGATLSRGVVVVDGMLRSPLTGINGALELDGAVLRARGLEARSGRSGSMRLYGALPLRPGGGGGADASGEHLPAEGLVAEASGLELRVRNAYSGLLDATVRVGGSLAAPVVGGELKLSRGTVYLMGSAGGGGAPAAPAPDAAAGVGGSGRSAEADMVSRAFAALKAGRRRAEDMVSGGQGAGRAYGIEQPNDIICCLRSSVCQCTMQLLLLEAVSTPLYLFSFAKHETSPVSLNPLPSSRTPHPHNHPTGRVRARASWRIRRAGAAAAAARP
jgi:hypothetical protein